MNNNRRLFQFGHPHSSNPLGKVADLFDIQYDAKKGEAHWEQETRGVLSKYRTNEQIPVNPSNDERKVEEIKYEVVGYDKFLVEKRTVQNLNVDKKSIGTIVEAEQILKGKLAKNIKPQKYIDGHGNVFQKQ